MSSVLEGTWKKISEYIFPAFCVQCGREGEILCQTCIDTLDVSGVFCCPVCHMDRAGGVCCDGCIDKTPLARHVAILPLTEISLIHKLIHLYKYEFVESLEPIFEQLIKRFFDIYAFSSAHYIVPVPLHRKRYIERGFNQSAHIARMVSTATGVPYLEPLRRIKNTIKQATLDRKGREMNVRDAFVVKKEFEKNLSGTNIVLIDDVYTTGSTLRECAVALSAAQVREVSGWSIARG